MAQSDAGERTRRLRAIWDASAPVDGLDEVDEVQVYRVVRSTNPDRRGHRQRHRIAVFRLATGLQSTNG
jgi:hypothetical protein